MKIETKFNEGDTIFFINNNKKVVSSICRGFKIESLYGKTTTTYLCNSKEDEQVHIKVDESDAFKSKEELLESL